MQALQPFCRTPGPCRSNLALQAPITLLRTLQIRQITSLRCCATGNGSSAPSPPPPPPSSQGPLPPPPDLKGKAPRKYWNAASLAFLGDSVWELYVRRRNFYPPTRVSDYYAATVRQVRAEAQAEACAALEAADVLTAEERDVLRWGRNATGTSPKRVSQGGMTREIYRAATAIECLSGYLYLTDPPRLHTIMVHLGMEGDNGGSGGGNGSGSGGSANSG